MRGVSHCKGSERPSGGRGGGGGRGNSVSLLHCRRPILLKNTSL